MSIFRKLFCPCCSLSWIYPLAIEESLYDKEILEITCYFCKENFNVYRNYLKLYLSRSLYAADLKYKYPLNIRKKLDGLLRIIDPINISDIDDRLTHITKSNIVIVAMQSLSSTDPFFELMYAKTLCKSCYIIDPGRQFSTDKWVHYAADKGKIFEETDDCLDAILPLIAEIK